MNRIKTLFSKKKNNILSIYFTAGYPKLNNTTKMIENLVSSGADMIEIGIPFSDPLADGPVIQDSSNKALKNGMSLSLLFEQIEDIRKNINIPLVLMGYLNPVYQYGIENFLKKCSEIGIDGVILPDLPIHEYEDKYKPLFEKYKIQKIFLVTPNTDTERIKKIDAMSDSFIYIVSSAATTGVKKSFTDDQIEYFKKIRDMKLQNPTLVGFGISNHEGYTEASKYANGVIIGSAFIKALGEEGELQAKISRFIKSIIEK